MTVAIDGSAGITFPDNKTQAGAGVSGNGSSTSVVEVDTGNGYGSSSTMVRRFTNNPTNQGADNGTAGAAKFSIVRVA